MNQTFAYTLQFVGAGIGILTAVGLVYWGYLVTSKDVGNPFKMGTKQEGEQ